MLLTIQLGEFVRGSFMCGIFLFFANCHEIALNFAQMIVSVSVDRKLSVEQEQAHLVCI